MTTQESSYEPAVTREPSYEPAATREPSYEPAATREPSYEPAATREFPHKPVARPGRYERRAKRALDVVLSLTGIVVLLPVLIASAVAVRLSGPGPVLLRQRRVGARGSVFLMAKFRTMVADAEADGRPVWSRQDDDRVTPVGRILRSSHLDELPQLWNVLVGEMSLVGPRPERPEISETLVSQIPHWHLRHGVRPGITGWAQVRQGYTSNVEEFRAKLSYDLYYLRHCSLRLDLVILAETLSSSWRPRRSG
ncbi:sugar transferase [Actinopolymorpha rutila]|uniref:Lipopolysaccharide/colanic/teichoic acid biosynthesis glycosyltransferase n=1 Tax=Actinopolymorpha rutila TaxID=446787 RepID=A0A852ZGV3_9ACTN|nr:sugar transferase [Actinopolymorpha rutila]NYH90892.1 lipopolysaccharide/colanic/teichoic acid biosynthesis glycosyltransferase [Actinopolymorpha rutila]